MAKINRYPGNLKAFAADALGTERTIFGDTAQADDLASNITADFFRGWGIVGVNENPTKQDFNGLAFTLGQVLAYLHQMGIPEWDDEQEFALNGFCIGSDGKLYQSQIAANIGNDPTTDGVNWINPFGRTDDITVTVGAGGDYATINEALADLSQYSPAYKAAGVTATINLLTGFVMEEQVLVRGIDLGWITITGDDASTTITHTALTTDFTTSEYGFASYPAFGVSSGGTLPKIGQLFIFSASGVGGNKHGVMAVGCSKSEIISSCGVQNAGTYGIFADHSSTINANSADASGAGTYGIYASSGSTINARSADASGAGTYGIIAGAGSTINSVSADASGAGTYGIFASNGSTINAESADASGAGTYGIFANNGSTINANSADASGAGTYGIFAGNGSTINANLAIIQNQTTGTYCLLVTDGSTVEASSIDTTGSTVTILSQAANTLTGNGIIYQ